MMQIIKNLVKGLFKKEIEDIKGWMVILTILAGGSFIFNIMIMVMIIVYN